MAKAPKKTKAKTDGLLAALKFVSVATKDNSHVRTFGKQLVGFSTPIAAGHPIEEELNLAPDANLLAKAVGKAIGNLSISESEGGRMTITSAKFRAQIPCLTSDYLSDFLPDPNIAPLNDNIREGFKLIGSIPNENGLKVFEASVLLQAQTMLATDSKLIVEFFHGNDLPLNLILPKPFVDAVAKSPYAVTGFGYSQGKSVTIWFENNSWIKTSLYVDAWPNLTNIFETVLNYIKTPESLFEGVLIVRDFAHEGVVKFENDKIISYGQGDANASFEVIGLLEGLMFNAELLLKTKPFAQYIDISSKKDRMFFQSDVARGVLMAYAV